MSEVKVKQRHLELALKTLYVTQPHSYNVERVARALAAAEQQGKEAAGPAWVDCRERLPEDEAIVLVFGHYDGMNSSWDFQAVCRFEESSGLWRGIPTDTASDEVTHWMPLPSPPSKPEGS